MAITFDLEKKKSISMMVETSGIDDKSKLSFTFNITVDGIRYGFPCKLEENRVDIDIPPLKSIIKNLKNGIYDASLDVTGNGKHFLQPFKESVVVTSEPKVDVIVDTATDKAQIKEDMMASISKIIENDEVKTEVKEDKVEEIKKPENPNKRMSKVFGK